MPSIITHFKLLTESRSLLRKKKDISPFTRTLESLFDVPEFRSAAYLGALGPDIFEFLPLTGERNHLGSSHSAFLHSRGLHESLRYFSDLTLKNMDYANEWASMQRAYFYGYVSHIITDQIFNPFVFYWTGFPRTGSPRGASYYREQRLLFDYNMDIYFQYYHDREETAFSLEKLLAQSSTPGRTRILKEPLFKLISSVFLQSTSTSGKGISAFKAPSEIFNQKLTYYFLKHISFIIDAIFKLKTTNRSKLVAVLHGIQMHRLLSPDIAVVYPEPRRLNKHVLNLHRERWFFPAGGAGLHYDSVDDLFKQAREKTVQIWEMLDSYLYGNGPRIESTLREIEIDCYTGERDKGPEMMSLCNEYRLRF